MNYIILLVCLVMAISTSGCGSMNETRGDVSERSYALKVDNPQVQEFNKQLGEISNEASAERAVNSFFNYVDSRLDKSSAGMSVQSLIAVIGPDKLQKMANKEAIARKVAMGVESAENGETMNPLIDVGTVTDNINTLGSTEGVRVNDEIVSTAQIAVEQSMPNINPDNKPGMTPLEASVVAYAITSGDDGTATEESVMLPVEKVDGFVENVTQ